ncbi:MAG: DUF2723 domain-containing protein [Gilvibacter sp.]
MEAFDFKKYSKYMGWGVFLISLICYILTAEPTASFWDAGEYITTASNLEVGHPPGAPLYQILGAFFSIFAMEPTNIAFTVNLMSAFSSAFTIAFMFWSISMLLENILLKDEKKSKWTAVVVLGSAFVGAMGFAFTDSFWFNAVEAEVYAMATFLLSILFYCGLRWEREMNEPRGDRWVILISLIVGLSFGVHFMGLLTIPAIGFLYFFKKTRTITLKNFLIANVVVVAILLFIFKLLLPLTMKLFSGFEIFFVNTIGLPFNSGTIIAGLVYIGAFYYLLKYTRKKSWVQLNTLLLCILFIFIGFSSWLMLPIRANAGTVINENNPNNAREVLAYYNREQYPETHLFYGPQFTELYAGLDEQTPYVDDKPKYEKNTQTGRYEIVNQYKDAKQNTDDAHKAMFPRMWSIEHNINYISYTDGLDFRIKREYLGEEQLKEEVAKFRQAYDLGYVDAEQYHSFLQNFGQTLDIEKPSFGDNISFMFSYQFGYMYWRYFAWNFIGRQDDVQGQGTELHGNWISGIPFVDSWNIGPQDNLDSDALTNRGRNTYYFLPLILGIIGLFFHLKRDPKSFWVLLVFFLFTGLALKVYLNERPFEPRERDYALVGSFYVFAIWIGFGVYALFDLAKDYLKPKVVAPVVIGLATLMAPVLLISQNWDDHDRSNRYTANSMARMYLDSCDENSILFTIGDNDTFALWYLQGIEEYRQDIRALNTSLFQTDWYIDSMKKKAYTSEPIPSQLTHDKYRTGTRDFVFFQEVTKDTMDINTWLNWIASDDPRTMIPIPSGHEINTFPSKHIRIPVDKEAVLKNGIVSPEDADKIVPYIDIELNGDVLYKNRLLMLDIIANNNWERPIYFTGGSFGDDDYLWMKDYLQLDGVTYKLVPIRTPLDPKNPFDMGRIDSDKMYEIVKNWDWGNSGSPDIYHDPETRRNGITYRSNVARLSQQLIVEKKFDKAEEMLDLAMEKMPVKYFEYYTLLEPFIDGYYAIDKPNKARAVYEETAKKYQEKLAYYRDLPSDMQSRLIEEILTDAERYRGLVDIVMRYDSEQYAMKEIDAFNSFIGLLENLYREAGIYDDGIQLLKDEPTSSIPMDTIFEDSLE